MKLCCDKAMLAILREMGCSKTCNSHALGSCTRPAELCQRVGSWATKPAASTLLGLAVPEPCRPGASHLRGSCPAAWCMAALIAVLSGTGRADQGIIANLADRFQRPYILPLHCPHYCCVQQDCADEAARWHRRSRFRLVRRLTSPLRCWIRLARCSFGKLMQGPATSG